MVKETRRRATTAGKKGTSSPSATTIAALKRRQANATRAPGSVEPYVVASPIDISKMNTPQPTSVYFDNKLGTPTPAKIADGEKQRVCREWFEQARKLGLRGIRKEFVNSVKKYKPDGTTSAFSHEDNTPKNRYDDIGLLDKTRVKVRISPDNDDYIHASFVQVHPQLTYICAQGPLSNTIQQFWLMCIQEETKVILQLCQNVENGREKCSDYMPKSSSWTTFGQVRVRVVKESAPVPGMRKVAKTVVQCQFEDRDLTLTHILYFGWPDHAVVEDIGTCRQLRALVSKLYERKPIVVHCSAGIGRTGSFVAIEMACHKLLTELKSDLSMADLVKELRNQRMLAVQNDQQYCCIFRCVLDVLLAEDGALLKTSEINKFIESYDEMLMRKKKTSAAKPAKKQGQTAEAD